MFTVQTQFSHSHTIERYNIPRGVLDDLISEWRMTFTVTDIERLKSCTFIVKGRFR